MTRPWIAPSPSDLCHAMDAFKMNINRKGPPHGMTTSAHNSILPHKQEDGKPPNTVPNTIVRRIRRVRCRRSTLTQHAHENHRHKKCSCDTCRDTRAVCRKSVIEGTKVNKQASKQTKKRMNNPTTTDTQQRNERTKQRTDGRTNEKLQLCCAPTAPTPPIR